MLRVGVVSSDQLGRSLMKKNYPLSCEGLISFGRKLIQWRQLLLRECRFCITFDSSDSRVHVVVGSRISTGHCTFKFHPSLLMRTVYGRFHQTPVL